MSVIKTASAAEWTDGNRNEPQIPNRFQSANRVRCDKTRVSFQQIWIKIGWREVLSADLEGLVLRKLTFIGTSAVSTLTFGRRPPNRANRATSRL